MEPRLQFSTEGLHIQPNLLGELNLQITCTRRGFKFLRSTTFNPQPGMGAHGTTTPFPHRPSSMVYGLSPGT